MMKKHNIFELGAIQKNTGEYVFPKIANKTDKYICPDCNKSVIFRKGTKNIAHFAHKTDDNLCSYYIHPSESQIHKDAKMLMKKLLENKIPIKIIKNCCVCKKNIEHSISKISDTSKIILEYQFKYNGLKIADVAYTNNDKIIYIFEICNTHHTAEINRPEPWFEIDAMKLISLANKLGENQICIKDIRYYICSECKCKKYYHIVTKNFNLSKRLYLNVSFSRKDEIKSYRGKWDSENKKWYIMANNSNRTEILTKFTKLDCISCKACNGTGIKYRNGDDKIYIGTSCSMCCSSNRHRQYCPNTAEGPCPNCCCVKCGKWIELCDC